MTCLKEKLQRCRFPKRHTKEHEAQFKPTIEMAKPIMDTIPEVSEWNIWLGITKAY